MLRTSLSAITLVLLLTGPALPATFHVTTTDDVLDPADGLLSLREAVLETNATTGADTIFVPAGTYALTRAGDREDGGLTGDLDLTGRVAIEGAGADVTIIDGVELDRVFDVHQGATVTLDGMTIQRGHTIFSHEAGIKNNGDLTVKDCAVVGNRRWGISNSGTLTVVDCAITGNGAFDGGIESGGGLVVRSSDISNNGWGIYSGGTATISNCTVSNNKFTGVRNDQGTMTLQDCTVSGNQQSGVFNGAYGDPTITISNCVITNNFTLWHGGGIASYWGTVTVNQSTIRDNIAMLGEGGGIYLDAFFRTKLTVNNSTISGNRAGGTGGGIYCFYGPVLTVNNSEISNNSAEHGGGIWTYAFDNKIENTNILNNTANLMGGGLAVAQYFVTITNSALVGNHAGVDGGGLFNFSVIDLRMSGSTLAGNSAGNHGGAIFNGNFSSTTLTECELFDNTAVFGGGAYNDEVGSLTLRDSAALANFADLGGDIYNAGLLQLFDSIVDDVYDEP